MIYRFISCQTEAQLEKYVFYMLDHMQEVHSAFTAKRIIHFYKEIIIHGQAFIVENKNSDVIGAGGFVYGTPENGFSDKDTVRIEMIHIHPTFRGTRLFLIGIVWLAKYLEQHAPKTKKIQFYTESEPLGRSRLFLKLADLIITEPTRFGIEDEFHTTISRLKQWEYKMIQRR